ncbi:subtilisin-like protein [Thozetella sp. PMI_491]|nr:subtilisin-like protein [Thozetella sp. PMI_491]
MARWQTLLVAAILGPLALGAVHEKLDAVPAGWTSEGVPSNTVATFTIALYQNFDDLERLLFDVSNPCSPHYGQHWNKTQVDERFNPGKNVTDEVEKWLVENGIHNRKVDGAFIDFTASIQKANDLLGANYQYYTKEGNTKLRTLQYSIPNNLRDSILLITPGIFFGNTRRHGGASRLTSPIERREEQTESPPKPELDQSCQASITPACLKAMYNVGDYKADPKFGSRVAFGSFLNESAIFSDLFLFEKYNNITRQNFTTVSIANGTLTQDPSLDSYGEANLDVQTIIGIAPGLPVTEYSTGGSPPFIPTLGQPTPADNSNEPYVPYYRYLLSLKDEDLPQVNSVSYGDQEDGVPLNYAQLTCNLAGLLGLRGITIIASSGDGGVGGVCLNPDFKTVEFGSEFPATCPYFTAVGGTSAVQPEIAWDESSGGFSKYFARPAWQNKTIENYIHNRVSAETRKYYGPYTNFTAGRGFPDIALHSLDPDFAVVYNNRSALSGGTSASAPLWAGIVGLLNDARLRAGKPVLGWLNPLIYALANQNSAFIDVTGGYSIGCSGTRNGSGMVLGARWNATTGWDPVTGFGIPDFQKLKAVVLTLGMTSTNPPSSTPVVSLTCT